MGGLRDEDSKLVNEEQLAHGRVDIDRGQRFGACGGGSPVSRRQPDR